MVKNNFRLRPGALREIRQLPAVREDLVRRAELIADRASEGGRVDGYKVTDLVLEDPRGAASVMAAGWHARAHNRKRNALVRALEAGRD